MLKRLTAVMTVAVFVFTTGFLPVDAFAETGDNGEIGEVSEVDEESIDDEIGEIDVIDESSQGTGYIDDTDIDDYLTVDSNADSSKKRQTLKAQSSLPAKFDSRQKTYYKGHVYVQDQDITNTCWAYALSTTAQISYLKERYDSKLSVNGDYHPAPLQFAYFFFNRQNYPYGYTKYDKNYTVEGDYLDNGGNNYCSVAALSNWMGLCRLSLPHKYRHSNAYKNFITLQNAKFLNNVSKTYTLTYKKNGKFTKIKKKSSVLDINAVKEAVYKYGAVTVQMYYDNDYYDRYGKGYYCDYYWLPPSEFGANDHAVTIVGWDDNFSRENFLHCEDPEFPDEGNSGSSNLGAAAVSGDQSAGNAKASGADKSAVEQESLPSDSVSTDNESTGSESTGSEIDDQKAAPSDTNDPSDTDDVIKSGDTDLEMQPGEEPADESADVSVDEATDEQMTEPSDAQEEEPSATEEETQQSEEPEVVKGSGLSDDSSNDNLGATTNYPNDVILKAQLDASKKYDGRPVSDGAWIVQNSHGVDKTGATNDKGYMYISYEDMSLRGAIALDMQAAGTYNANFQYDGNGFVSSNVNAGMKQIPVGGEVANVFTVPNDGKKHTLKAVSFMEWDTKATKYNIRVYKNVKTNPNSGTQIANFNVSTGTAGYYTFDLKKCGVKPAVVPSGSKYSVIVKATSTSDPSNKLKIALERAVNSDVAYFRSEGKPGTCFFRNNSKVGWSDLYKTDTTASFRIKAMTTTVTKPRLAKAKVTTSRVNYNYTGKAVMPNPTVKLSGKTLKKGTDYTVTYSNNKMPGIAKITIKAKMSGNYYGSKTKAFTIGGVEKFRAAKVGKKTVTLKWSKAKGMSGYKIYRLKSGKWKCIKTIKKNKKVSFKNKKLKRKKTYKYKIIAYKKIGKKKYYGPYSPVITVKTK